MKVPKFIVVSLFSMAITHAKEVTPSIEIRPADSDLGLGLEVDPNRKADLHISVDLDGTYSINKKKITSEHLKKELSKLKAANPNPLVKLSVNAEIEANLLVELLNIFVDKGISNIQFSDKTE